MWLALLRRLTSEAPDWFTMKGIESAIHGTGDVDSIAPPASWPVVKAVFLDWARDEGLGPVVYCPHAPFLTHMVALCSWRPEVFELDVNARKIFFGSTLFRPRDVAHLAILDDRGFRRLRPGAEGVLKLVQNGSTRSGRCRPDAMAAKGVAELLAGDTEGVELFAARFGSGAPDVVRAAEAAIAGGWDRRAVRAAKLACLYRSPREPDAIAARARFRWQRSHCPVLRTVLSGQRRVDDPERWVAEVGATHEVVL